MDQVTPLGTPDTEKGLIESAREKRVYIVKRMMTEFENILVGLSFEELLEKFLAGRANYGGAFDINSIHTEIEKKGEVADFFWYVAMEEYVKYLEDPSSFDEYVSQYMQ